MEPNGSKQSLAVWAWILSGTSNLCSSSYWAILLSSYRIFQALGACFFWKTIFCVPKNILQYWDTIWWSIWLLQSFPSGFWVSVIFFRNIYDYLLWILSKIWSIFNSRYVDISSISQLSSVGRTGPSCDSKHRDASPFVSLLHPGHSTSLHWANLIAVFTGCKPFPIFTFLSQL